METLGGYESTLRDVLFRAIKKFHPDSNGKAPVLNTCYNTERYETYLRKDEDCIDVDTDNFDAELFRLALSDQATQSALQDAQRRKPIGAYWIDHEKRWIERYPDNSSYECAIRYFKERMFVLRDMEPISNLKKLRENAYTLYAYRNRSMEPDFGDIAHMKKEFDGENIFKNVMM